MKRSPARPRPLAAAAASLLAWAACAADEPARPAEGGALVVVDAAGKEHRLKAWKFLVGTRRLGWLAPASAGKEPAGPEALVFREENSTAYREGILTLVPLDRLRALEYDPEKEAVTARVAAGKGNGDTELKGLTKYQGVNKLALEGEEEKGELGVAEVRFQGGVAKGVRAVRLPAPKAGPPPAEGRPAVVTTAEPQPSAHKVADLQPLYRVEGGHERLSPLLMFKKTLKLDVGKVHKLTAGGDQIDSPWQVVLKDGSDQSLTLLRTPALDGKEAQLVGLLGRVPAGYKLFPLHAVAEVVFDATEPEAKPENKSESKPEPKRDDE
jgi:hypothetical protein